MLSVDKLVLSQKDVQQQVIGEAIDECANTFTVVLHLTVDTLNVICNQNIAFLLVFHLVNTSLLAT